jgi:hypothetical protein
METYSRENEDAIPSSCELTLQDWVEWHSTDLLNMWRGIVVYLEDTCLTRDIILPYSDYHDFCEYCYHRSSKLASKNAT